MSDGMEIVDLRLDPRDAAGIAVPGAHGGARIGMRGAGVLAGSPGM